jgi:hypothetical protein
VPDCPEPWRPPRSYGTIPEHYLVLITCRDERQRAELLGRCQREGLDSHYRPGHGAAGKRDIHLFWIAKRCE